MEFNAAHGAFLNDCDVEVIHVDSTNKNVYLTSELKLAES